MERPPRAAKSHACDEVKRLLTSKRRPNRDRSMTLEAEDRSDGAVAEKSARQVATKIEDTNTTSTKDPVSTDRVADTPAMAAPVPRRSMRGQSLGKSRVVA